MTYSPQGQTFSLVQPNTRKNDRIKSPPQQLQINQSKTHNLIIITMEVCCTQIICPGFLNNTMSAQEGLFISCKALGWPERNVKCAL